MPEPIDPSTVDVHEIARRGDAEVLAVFLDAGLDPNLRDDKGYSLLMIAAYNDQPDTTALLLGARRRPRRAGRNGQHAVDGHGLQGPRRPRLSVARRRRRP